jgi:hypothetical protein
VGLTGEFPPWYKLIFEGLKVELRLIPVKLSKKNVGGVEGVDEY